MANSVTKILESVPHNAICDRLAVKERSIRLAKERGVFPASWFSEMKKLCVEHGVDCPQGVFNWKAPREAKRASGGAGQ